MPAFWRRVEDLAEAIAAPDIEAPAVAAGEVQGGFPGAEVDQEIVRRIAETVGFVEARGFVRAEEPTREEQPERAAEPKTTPTVGPRRIGEDREPQGGEPASA